MLDILDRDRSLGRTLRSNAVFSDFRAADCGANLRLTGRASPTSTSARLIAPSLYSRLLLARPLHPNKFDLLGLRRATLAPTVDTEQELSPQCRISFCRPGQISPAVLRFDQTSNNTFERTHWRIIDFCQLYTYRIHALQYSGRGRQFFNAPMPAVPCRLILSLVQTAPLLYYNPTTIPISAPPSMPGRSTRLRSATWSRKTDECGSFGV